MTRAGRAWFGAGVLQADPSRLRHELPSYPPQLREIGAAQRAFWDALKTLGSTGRGHDCGIGQRQHAVRYAGSVRNFAANENCFPLGRSAGTKLRRTVARSMGP